MPEASPQAALLPVTPRPLWTPIAFEEPNHVRSLDKALGIDEARSCRSLLAVKPCVSRQKSTKQDLQLGLDKSLTTLAISYRSMVIACQMSVHSLELELF